MTDADESTLQHRIADLLDDVTEVTPAAEQPQPAPKPVLDETAPLPPFLAQTPSLSRPPQRASLPGTSLFASTAASAPTQPGGASQPAPAAGENPSVPPPAAAAATAMAATTTPASTAASIPPATPPTTPVTTPGTTPGTTANGAEPIAKADAAATEVSATAASPNATAAQQPSSSNATVTAASATTAAAAASVRKSAKAGETQEELGRSPGLPGTVSSAAIAVPITIRGRGDGLVVELGKGSWSDILAALDYRLQQSASFFRNARVAIDLGARTTSEAELESLLELLQKRSMILGAVRTSAESTFQAGLSLGLTTSLESEEGTPVAEAAPAATNTPEGAYFVYRGYLRSGHHLYRPENILVIGDVNPGAEVVSEGDILVWGRLRGVAHAGSNGNSRAIVAALDMEPTQLHIAEAGVIRPDARPGQGKWFWRRSETRRPEIARIHNQVIVIEEWDTSLPGGLVRLRRGG